MTIAGNLAEMLTNVTAIGNDLEFRGAVASPTLRIDGMTIAGALSLSGMAGSTRIRVCNAASAFDPADAKAALAQLPTAPAVFALYGAEAHAEPYIGRTPNLRARLERLLAALGQASAPLAVGRARAADSLAADRLGV